MLTNLFLRRPFRIIENLNRSFHLSVLSLPKNILSDSVELFQICGRAELGLHKLETFLRDLTSFFRKQSYHIEGNYLSKMI
jgi:hypothetical protein